MAWNHKWILQLLSNRKWILKIHSFFADVDSSPFTRAKTHKTQLILWQIMMTTQISGLNTTIVEDWKCLL